MKKLIFILALTIGIFIPIKVNAAEDDIFGCIDIYYSYIGTAVSEKSRGEIFKDFTRSYCQVNDLIAINDQLETLRDTFKTAAQNCQDTSEYSKTYTKLLMEQYFIRNIQKIPSDLIGDAEVEKIKSEKKRKLEKLEDEMNKLFVIQENRVGEEDFAAYYEEWSAKYDDSIIKYAHCDEGPWAELTTTWNDFIDKMKSIKVKPEPVEFEVPKNNNQPFTENISKNIIEYMEKFAEDYKISITPEQKVSDVVGATFQDVLKTLGESSEVYDAEIENADRLAKYRVLYAEGGARVSSNFQTVVQDLNKIITDSNNVEFKDIKKRVDQVKEKQCK